MSMDAELQSLVRLLQTLNTHHSIHKGKQLHLLFFKKGLIDSTLSLANRLLQMYTRCGSMSNARALFEEMPHRNCFSWNTIIEGYMKSGDKDRSLEFFDLMPDKNDYSWNVVVLGSLKAGEVKIARRFFNDMPRRNGLVWSSMIHYYAQNVCPWEALGLFKQLNSRPLERFCIDAFVLAPVIGACTALRAIRCCEQIHARILIDDMELDSVLASSLVNCYAKCGDLDRANCVLNLMEEPDDFSLSALIMGYANYGRTDDARRILDRKSNPSVEVWNSLISGYVSNNKEMEVFALLNEMLRNGTRVNCATVAIVLSACSSLGSYQHGKQIHTCALKFGLIDDIVVISALIDAYAKCDKTNDACQLYSELIVYDTVLLNSMITLYCNCGRIKDAKQVFNTMPQKSLISWNSMIAGLSQNGCPIEALDLFCQMNKLDMRMDTVSFASVIGACACVTSIELGEQVFARAIITGLESDEVLCTSLIDFYCKCGFIENGRKLFDTMVKSDVAPWNSMLMGYATNGHGLKVLEIFYEMRHSGMKPNYITFIGVLSGCDHCGFLDEGWKWFNVMIHEYRIDPGIEHYSCMVDLFARGGYLGEAFSLIEHMPFKADTGMWSTLLRGCVVHRDKDLGEKVAKRIIEMDPENSAAYIQLSSLFAASGDWESSAFVRKIMRNNAVQKNPGYSWAEC